MTDACFVLNKTYIVSLEPIDFVARELYEVFICHFLFTVSVVETGLWGLTIVCRMSTRSYSLFSMFYVPFGGLFDFLYVHTYCILHLIQMDERSYIIRRKY
jgi:hypothetical protein